MVDRRCIEASLLSALISTRTEVKKPRKVDPLAPLAQNVTSSLPRGQELAKPPHRTLAEREALRRDFQRDIDDTVAELLAEEAENNPSRELNFDGVCLFVSVCVCVFGEGCGIGCVKVECFQLDM